MIPRLTPLAFIQAFYPWVTPPPAQDDEQIDYFVGLSIYAAEVQEIDE